MLVTTDPPTGQEEDLSERIGNDTDAQIIGLADLAKYPQAPVLVLQRAEVRDAVNQKLKGLISIAYSGGLSGLRHIDWSPLAGRNVDIWPVADELGWYAANALVQHIRDHCVRVRVIDTAGQPLGWDISDALAAGWDAKQLISWASAHVRVPKPKPTQLNGANENENESRNARVPAPEPKAQKKPKPKKAPLPIEEESVDDVPQEQPEPESHALVAQSVVFDAREYGLDKDEGGRPHATIASVSTILQLHPKYKGLLWLDTFRNQLFLDQAPATDQVVLDTTVFFQRELRLPKFTLAIVREGVMHAAAQNPHNSLTEWLNSLVWDGQERLGDWLYECLGVTRTKYSQAVARNWPIAMIARAFEPGCQVDTMPVLEGKMGRGKSTFLEILGGKWYCSLSEAFGSKDFMQGIQGQWLIEVPDMSGFSRREHSHILAIITTRNDRYRASYGRLTEDHPRVAMFAATSETDDYLQDARGRRRYWPLRCKKADLEQLRECRSQVFAEALVRYRQGSSWYEMPERETDEEQILRREPDVWSEKVLRYANEVYEHADLSGLRGMVMTPDILLNAIEMPIERQTDVEKKRIARILRDAGWIPTRTSTQRHWRKTRMCDDDDD